MDWYPWYFKTYKSNTRHLTAEQDGIYRRLLDEYMETREPLPDDDVALSRIAGVNEIKWLDASSIVRAFFKHKNGLLFHDFCDNQLDIQDKKSKRRSLIAEKAAKKRWKKFEQKQEDECIEHASSNSQAMLTDATETVTVTKKEKEKILKKEKVEKPDDVDEAVWKDFITHRKVKKAPVTESVIKTFRAEAKKINWTLQEAILETCLRGWQGFKSEWVQNSQTKGNYHGKKSDTELAMEAGDRAVQRSLAHLTEE